MKEDSLHQLPQLSMGHHEGKLPKSTARLLTLVTPDWRNVKMSPSKRVILEMVTI
jgi:hypothetical protein